METKLVSCRSVHRRKLRIYLLSTVSLVILILKSFERIISGGLRIIQIKMRHLQSWNIVLTVSNITVLVKGDLLYIDGFALFYLIIVSTAAFQLVEKVPSQLALFPRNYSYKI